VVGSVSLHDEGLITRNTKARRWTKDSARQIKTNSFGLRDLSRGQPGHHLGAGGGCGRCSHQSALQTERGYCLQG